MPRGILYRFCFSDSEQHMFSPNITRGIFLCHGTFTQGCRGPTFVELRDKIITANNHVWLHSDVKADREISEVYCVAELILWAEVRFIVSWLIFLV